MNPIPDNQVKPPNLRLATFEDYEPMAQLELDNGMTVMSREDWLAMWLDNPLWPKVSKDWPIGWLLETDAGRLVGTLVNIPTLYLFRGREFICGTGRSWAVDPQYRGFALWLMSEYFDQPNVDLFVNTTVADVSEPMHAALSVKMPVGDFQTILYWVTSYQGFAKRALEKLRVPAPSVFAVPAAVGLRMKDYFTVKRIPEGPSSIQIESVENFDDRFESFWIELVKANPNVLLGARDQKTLQWHFASPLKSKRLWIVTASTNGVLRAYGIFKRQEREGGMKRMQLVDFQSLESQEDLLAPILRHALRRCKREGIFALEQLGYDVPGRGTFERFAPYRRKLPNCPFFYKAVDPQLEAELAVPEVWAPSTYDGDASFD